jgi:hypothetical protein
MPETKDTVSGVGVSRDCAQILAWVGEMDQALEEIARLLRAPYGANVHALGVDPGWIPISF